MNSFWLENAKSEPTTKKINKDYTTDVCVIGAGICGLSIGYNLVKSGLNVILIDKDKIGSKTSGHTTAKITLQHGLIYDYLINTYGISYALKYFNANKQAISNIKNVIDTENIECDFEYQTNTIYTTNKEEIPKIENEVSAINALQMYLNGEKYAKFVTNLNLPFQIQRRSKNKKSSTISSS